MSAIAQAFPYLTGFERLRVIWWATARFMVPMERQLLVKMLVAWSTT